MTKGNWTVVKESGRTEFYADTAYHSVIAAVGHQFMRTGSNWDRPNVLLFNGKVVVESGLAELGYRFVERCRELREAMEQKLREEFTFDVRKDT